MLAFFWSRVLFRCATCNRHHHHHQHHHQQQQQVRYSYGASSHAALKALGVPAEFLIVQGMGHSAAPGELRAVCDFVKRVAPPL
jgi:hypothetical protein